MKATGIVRRIDDLGRVVVPKEIRRTLRIREGDPLEIFTDREGGVILRKYSPIRELGEFAQQYAESLSQTTGHTIAIADRDQIIAAAGDSKKDLLSKKTSADLGVVLDERKTFSAKSEDKDFVQVINQELDFVNELIAPIISEGDLIGAVIMLTKDSKAKLGETEEQLSETAAFFLGSQMEQ